MRQGRDASALTCRSVPVERFGVCPDCRSLLRQVLQSLNNIDGVVSSHVLADGDQAALGGVYKIATIYDASLSHDEIVAMKAAVRSGAVEPK